MRNNNIRTKALGWSHFYFCQGSVTIAKLLLLLLLLLLTANRLDAQLEALPKRK
jgi:hypothetical protein